MPNTTELGTQADLDDVGRQGLIAVRTADSLTNHRRYYLVEFASRLFLQLPMPSVYVMDLRSGRQADPNLRSGNLAITMEDVNTE